MSLGERPTTATRWPGDQAQSQAGVHPVVEAPTHCPSRHYVLRHSYGTPLPGLFQNLPQLASTFNLQQGEPKRPRFVLWQGAPKSPRSFSLGKHAKSAEPALGEAPLVGREVPTIMSHGGDTRNPPVDISPPCIKSKVTSGAD